MGWHGAGGWWFLWPVGWLLILFLFFGIARFWFWGRREWGPYRGGPYGYWGTPHDSGFAILRERLARGEIDETEYLRLKGILDKNP